MDSSDDSNQSPSAPSPDSPAPKLDAPSSNAASSETPSLTMNADASDVRTALPMRPRETVTEIQQKRTDFLKEVAQRLRFAGNCPEAARLRAVEVKRVALYAREKLMLEPGFLDLEPPLTVVGDIHGQFSDLIGMFEQNGDPPITNFLFLGDYVDRGPFQTNTIVLLLAYKCLYPKSFYILRGNHETRVINRCYGFFEELAANFKEEGKQLWELYQTVFSCLPICARIGRRIFCMHGGIPRHLLNWKQLEMIRKPLEIPDHGVLCDLLWADPDPDTKTFSPSPRGVSYLFGEEALGEFCNKMSLDLIIRAHQVARDGYEFFANRRLVTIFSAPFYCEEFDNVASVLLVDTDLRCSFRLRQPVGIEKKVMELSLATMEPPDRCRLPVPPKLNVILGDEQSDGPNEELNISTREVFGDSSKKHR